MGNFGPVEYFLALLGISGRALRGAVRPLTRQKSSIKESKKLLGPKAFEESRSEQLLPLSLHKKA